MVLTARIVAVCLLIAASFAVNAQKLGNYDPHEAFAADFYPTYGDDIRTADGRPGPKYWQNKADYVINASLNDQTETVTGDVTITYTNNSPSPLSFVWLQLDQNIYDDQSRGV